MNRVFRSICLILAAALLAGGYALDSSWVGAAAVLTLAACWGIGRRFHWNWLHSALLAGYGIAAAGGILLGISAHWMIAGCAFGLAGWELASEDWVPTNDPALPWRILLWRKTLPSLAGSVGLGLLAAEILLLVRVSVPFGVMLLAALLGIVSLYLFYRAQKARP